MFRMPPQVDPAEEQKRVRDNVRTNFLIFGVLCAAIRVAPFLLDKVRTA
ncbi:uncharacterized protein LOC129943257 [Eupeodes corollae]|nr:uncharacterized protein LOC129943257 [Eupeodes corollae]